MHYGKLFCFIGVSAIAFLGSGLTSLSQEPEKPRPPFEVRLVPPAPPASGGGCDLDNEKSLRSERVELYYYRNATNMVNILSRIPLVGEGCATTLPLNQLQPGLGVGRGGGNIISLYGTNDYIESAKRFITSLDLPLPGINLQLWGVQISGKDPNRLAETTSKVRWRIRETQRLLRSTFDTVQGISQITLQNNSPVVKVDQRFQDIAKQLGYADALDGLGGESSILEVFLVGNTVKDPAKFYIDLYEILAKGTIEDGQFVADNEALQPYFDAVKNDIDRPPFERIFRFRGLEPNCMYPQQYQQLKQQEENKDLKCEQWKWEKKPVPNVPPESGITLVEITSNFERKVLLEFALHYADFISNPDQVDPEELQRTANNLNELLQKASNLLQKDIEDFFIKPTLSIIQEIVAKDKKLEFAQVGRNTISTLDGVETIVSTSSTSGFQIAQSQDVGQLLSRAETLQGMISNFLPTGAVGDASVAAETAATGVPVSRLLGLAIAALEQNFIPLEIETGTSLAFTPGISRNLNAAELNINLTVVDPTVKPTAEEKKVPPISRIGKQELHTTVYTRALDFFDLSTFTSQATLDGGRFRIPIIGNIWNAVFGAIPVFGDLFSISRGNQNVLHESLILTNSFITPTPLSLGNLYSPIASGFDFCQLRKDVLDYSNKYLAPGGQASPRDTKIISVRCSQQYR
ncbi:MAG: hypothetical protein QNJ55_06790 [Xenococcus sp. MO_188.B8]|nr:hypothetical protein [Xenococcus sp. MO_188.B8]